MNFKDTYYWGSNTVSVSKDVEKTEFIYIDSGAFELI